VFLETVRFNMQEGRRNHAISHLRVKHQNQHQHTFLLLNLHFPGKGNIFGRISLKITFIHLFFHSIIIECDPGHTGE
jgi:hypothetical protein